MPQRVNPQEEDPIFRASPAARLNATDVQNVKILPKIINDLKKPIVQNVIHGKDGKTPQRGVDYFTYKQAEAFLKMATPIKGIHYRDGMDGKPGRDGIGLRGYPGSDGKTPVKGVDYRDGKDGKDGKDGRTPIKGVDYFDGKDGKDGRDGVDGKDGRDGVDGKDGRDGVDGKDGRDGKINQRAIMSFAREPVQSHESAYDHKLIHSPYQIGSKMISEEGLKNGFILSFDQKKDAWVPVPIPAPIILDKEGYGGGMVLPSMIGNEGKYLQIGLISKQLEWSSLDLSGYLTLDQTTPQSVINGSPIMEGIQFNTTPTTTANAEGLLRWNSTDGTLDLGMSGGNIIMQMGQEMFMKVRNVSGSTIANGTPVYISGRTGNRPNIYPARSDATATSCIVGITTQDIDSPADGFITTFGYVRQIKTDYSGTGDWGTTWAEGDKLYVSKTVAGKLTNVEPTAPHHSDIVATVGVVGGSGIGSILVNIQEHTTLNELTDVDGSAPDTTGDLITWNQTSNVWERNAYNITDYLTTATAATTYLKLDQSTPQTLTASPYFNNLTAGRVPYVTTGGALTDSANLVFNGTDLTVSGLIKADGTTGGFYRSKTLTANSTYPSLNISTTYEWTGSAATVSSSTYEATDHRVVTGGFSDSMYGLRVVVKKESPASTVKNPNFYGVDFSLTDTGTHTTGSTASTVACMRAILLYAPTFNTGGTINTTVSGFDVSISAAIVPTLTSGTLNQTSYGYRVYGTAHTVGAHTLYDFYTAVTGADVHYGFYNAGTGNNHLGNDNIATTIGSGLDSGYYYDGTNTIWKNYVGTGYFDLQMALKTTGLTVTNLTSGRVPYATTGGALTDSANMLFNGTNLTVNGNITANGILLSATGGNYGFYGNRTFSSAPVFPSLNIEDFHNYSGGNAITTSQVYLGDNRTINSGKSVDDVVLNFSMIRQGTTSINYYTLTGIKGYAYDRGTYTYPGDVTVVSTGMLNVITVAPIVNIGAGNTMTETAYGYYTNIGGGSPTITSGSLVVNTYGIYVTGTASAVGTQTLYDFYSNATGADTHYCFYNATTDGNNLLGLDNIKSYFGTGIDASIYYDGTNLVINPKDVGTGYLSILGNANAVSFQNTTPSSTYGFLCSRSHTSTAGTAISVAETYTYAGTGLLSTLSCLATDSRTIVAGKSNGIVSLNFGTVNQAAINSNNYTGYGIQGYYQNKATYTYAGSVSTTSYGAITTIAELPTVNIGAGNTYTSNAYGYTCNLTNSVPTVTSGTYVQNTYIFSVSGAGKTVGTQTGYDFYSSVTGFGTHWCLYNAGTGHNFLGGDNIVSYIGSAQDVGWKFDGTNTILYNAVGSGIFDVQMVLQTDGYNSSDGSAGVSGSFTTTDGKTITIKDGLVTSIV